MSTTLLHIDTIRTSLFSIIRYLLINFRFFNTKVGAPQNPYYTYNIEVI